MLICKRLITGAILFCQIKTNEQIAMEKRLHISAQANGKECRIMIDGDISEWNDNNASTLRETCKNMKDAGAINCFVYIVTYGGDCFQANEMYNILIENFPEGYDGEGGAIVASAGTYLAVKAKTFTLAQNGQFMIHKPMGGAFGNQQEISNYLDLLNNMTATYYDAYMAKCKKPEAEFKAKWDGGDNWMNATQAEEWGFITGVKKAVAIDETTAKAIKACGSPITINNHENQIEMELRAMAIGVGLHADATEQQVTAKLAEIRVKAEGFDQLKAEIERKEKEQRAGDIKAVLDKAESDKRIKADSRADWTQMLEANFDTTKKVIEALPVVAKLSAEIVTSASGDGKTYQGKTFEQLQDDPDLLAHIEQENPEVFEVLFADYKKRNNLK